MRITLLLTLLDLFILQIAYLRHPDYLCSTSGLFIFIMSAQLHSLCLLLFLSFSVIVSSFVAGGQSAVSVSNPRVVDAAEFAFAHVLRAGLVGASSFEIESARQQVVAGMNYFLKVQMLGDGGECLWRHEFVVYDKFGTLSLTSEKRGGAC